MWLRTRAVEWLGNSDDFTLDRRLRAAICGVHLNGWFDWFVWKQIPTGECLIERNLKPRTWVAEVYPQVFCGCRIPWAGPFAMVLSSKSCSLHFPIDTYTGAVNKRAIGLIIVLHASASHMLRWRQKDNWTNHWPTRPKSLICWK